MNHFHCIAILIISIIISGSSLLLTNKHLSDFNTRLDHFESTQETSDRSRNAQYGNLLNKIEDIDRGH